MKPSVDNVLIVELSLYCLNFGGRFREAVVVYNGRNKAELPTNPVLKTVTGDNWTTYRNPIDFNHFAEEFQRLGAAITAERLAQTYFNIKVGQGAVYSYPWRFDTGDALLPANFEPLTVTPYEYHLIATPTSLGWIGQQQVQLLLSLKPADVVNTEIDRKTWRVGLDTVYRMHDVVGLINQYYGLDFADMFTDPDGIQPLRVPARIQALATANAIGATTVYYDRAAIPTSDEDLAKANGHNAMVPEVNIENNLDLKVEDVVFGVLSRYKDFDMPLLATAEKIIIVWRLSS
ncbi:hypothetical protein SPFM12_00145 [Salmonella phage SPFM12]|nr:hypothetical protein SPFM12_00145 [Salmonella phage SPFM12]